MLLRVMSALVDGNSQGSALIVDELQECDAINYDWSLITARCGHWDSMLWSPNVVCPICAHVQIGQQGVHPTTIKDQMQCRACMENHESIRFLRACRQCNENICIVCTLFLMLTEAMQGRMTFACYFCANAYSADEIYNLHSVIRQHGQQLALVLASLFTSSELAQRFVQQVDTLLVSDIFDVTIYEGHEDDDQQEKHAIVHEEEFSIGTFVSVIVDRRQRSLSFSSVLWWRHVVDEQRIDVQLPTVDIDCVAVQLSFASHAIASIIHSALIGNEIGCELTLNNQIAIAIVGCFMHRKLNASGHRRISSLYRWLTVVLGYSTHMALIELIDIHRQQLLSPIHTWATLVFGTIIYLQLCDSIDIEIQHRRYSLCRLMPAASIRGQTLRPWAMLIVGYCVQVALTGSINDYPVFYRR